MAQVDTTVDNKPDEETIKDATSDVHLYEKNQVTSKTKQISTNNDLVRLSTEVTPMYIKNPMYAKNRLSEALESASNENNTKDDKSFFIEPSPSGVTRIKINNYDSNNNQINSNLPNNPPINNNYQPIAVQFISHPNFINRMQFSTFQTDISQKPSGIITNAHHFQTQHFIHQNQQFQSNQNKIDTCTSPIKILNAKYEEPIQLQKDAFTQIEKPEAQKLVKEKAPETIIEEPPKTGMFIKNRDFRTNLEKSKLIVVNVTPKTSKKELEELSLPTSPNSKKTFELDMETDVVVKTNEPQFNESVAEIPLQAPGSNTNFNHLQQSNQTPILTYMLKQQKMQIIDRPKSDPNEILNLESKSYYDNITKLKQINDPQQIYRNQESTNRNSAFEPEQLQQQEQQLQQPEFNYKLIEKLNETNTNKNLSLNQRDQCLQFPTPGGLVDQSKKLPRTHYNLQHMNTESKTGFMNLDPNLDEKKYDNETTNIKPIVETFYDGNKVWTATTNMIKQESSEDDNNMDDIDGIYSAVNKKKNVQVKIKLPNETVSEIDEPEIINKEKKRNGQRCCFFLLIFILLLIVFGLVVYFFAWDVLIRRNIFN